MRVLLSCLAFSLLAGCDQFRYYCQNPDHWEKPRCQRPQCAVTGTCPDQLIKPEVLKEEPK
jgi:hypothetical protein